MTEKKPERSSSNRARTAAFSGKPEKVSPVMVYPVSKKTEGVGGARQGSFTKCAWRRVRKSSGEQFCMYGCGDLGTPSNLSHSYK